MKNDLNILVIGGGIAGVQVALEIVNTTNNVTFFSGSSKFPGSSLKAGASLVPIKITPKGIRYADIDVYQKVVHRYHFLEEKLNESFLYPKTLCIYDKNRGDVKIGQSEYLEYSGAYFLNVRQLLDRSIQYLSDKCQIDPNVFNYSELSLLTDGVLYRDVFYDKVIFCEGFYVNDNPYFKNLPLTPNWGLALIMTIDGLGSGFMYHHQKRLLPIENNQWWYGAEHIWNPITPSELDDWVDLQKAYLDLWLDGRNCAIQEVICQPRPTTPGQFPYIGQHPQWPQLYIFNGLGSKGMQISAQYVESFVEYALGVKSIIEGYDTKKFQSLLNK